jgi:hypothetical protein
VPIAISSGKHFTMRAERECAICHELTWQLCCGYRYRAWPEPTVPMSYRKELTWVCELCGENTVEVKQAYEPTDRLRIIKRLLRFTDDYDFIKIRISSQPNEILVRIQVPDFDPSQIRAIQSKQQISGFISAGELMQLRKAGFRDCRDVPPKPQPRDPGILRERARQLAFHGDPRSA